MREDPGARAVFAIARNPEEDSKLPYLIRLPIEGGLVLKARDTWPRSARVYCHPFDDGWPRDADILGAWLADVLARLQVRYPEVPIVFADSRRFAEEWTYRFLAAALADGTGAGGGTRGAAGTRTGDA